MKSEESADKRAYEMIGAAVTEEAQMINYLKATGICVGFLINFDSKSLEYKRFAVSDKHKAPVQSA